MKLNKHERLGLEAIIAISTMVVVSVIITLGFLGPLFLENGIVK